MGMFLPPMDGPTDPWKNDVEGTQTRANCSYNSIDKNYADIQAEGFSTLSYFNVFEYGINVQHGDDRGTVPATLNQENWPNASLYLENNFRPALVTNFVCAGGSPCNSREWAPVEGKSQSSWQGSVVVDPREGPSVHLFWRLSFPYSDECVADGSIFALLYCNVDMRRSRVRRISFVADSTQDYGAPPLPGDCD